jgi:hypothetical protein
MENLFSKLGVHIPEIVLPADGIELEKWSVIACDQYTSQPEYWQKVDEIVGDAPSTLRLTFPEIYLKEDDKEERIRNINQTMAQYLEQGILKTQKPGFILVDRSTPHTPSRKGLIVALDLECYDYTPGSDALIRATEGTVLDRIPPRVKIRENALIELPHIMVLIDDPGRTVIEPLFEKAAWRCERTESAFAGSEGSSSCEYRKLYDLELMQGGGHIRGWKIDDAESLSMVAFALRKLADPATFIEKYGVDHPLLFAVGDGNHSLASAKAHWENVKALLMAQTAPGGTAAAVPVPDHPARYALVEIVNVHDDGLAFEPIHRVLFGIDSNSVLNDMISILGEDKAEFRMLDSRASMEEACRDAAQTAFHASERVHLLPFILEGQYGFLCVKSPQSNLAVGTLQAVLDQLGRKLDHMEVDYIHGDTVVTEIGFQKNCMGFYLPVMSKHDLFQTVILDGVLPRKTFSMGEAEEKRYYLECRRIR